MKSNISSPFRSDALRSDWSHLPPDLQFYLTYFYKNITHLHYALKFDSGNFLRTTFLDAALRNEALLYAVVGFSAFQRTLRNPAGKNTRLFGVLQQSGILTAQFIEKRRKTYQRHNTGNSAACDYRGRMVILLDNNRTDGS